MKRVNYIILSAVIILTLSVLIKIYFVSDKAIAAGFYDIQYVLEYSPDSTFQYISDSYMFYDRVRNRYYLKPSQIEVKYWINKGSGTFGSEMKKYARIKSITDDSITYLTEPIKFMGCILKDADFKNIFYVK
jgi:hypothetical protein